MDRASKNSQNLKPRTGYSDGSSDDVDSTTDLRRRLREEARRHRIRQRLITVTFLLVPVALAGLYLIFLVAPRYVAETRFTVQAAQSNPSSSSSSSSGSPLTSLLSQGNGATSAATGFVDGWAVDDFLNSRDSMRRLDQKIGLRKYLSKASLDPLDRLNRNSNEDDLFGAYKKTIRNYYNMIEQINVVDIGGFSSSDSTVIANGVLEVVQDFVNQMNQQGIEDALKVSRQTVGQAEQRDRAALAAISQWRIEHGNVDPTADATMLLNEVGQLEASLSAAEVNLDKIKALGNPDHPMLEPARRQVEYLASQLKQLRGRISGQGDTPAAQLKTYVQLTNEQAFADSNLLQARQGYQQAFTNAIALERYLSIIVRPVSEARPSDPNPIIVLILAFGIGCGLAGLYNLARILYRSFRHA